MDQEIRMLIEKRRYVRLEINLNVQFKIENSPGNKTYSGVTKDISNGGMCVKIMDEREELIEKFDDLKPELRIALELVEPDETVEASAKTAWISSRIDWMRKPSGDHDPLYIGLNFEKVEQSVMDRINSYIADKFISKYQVKNP